jgi:hypothetical protein
MFNVVLICIMMHHLCIHVNSKKGKIGIRFQGPGFRARR